MPIKGVSEKRRITRGGHLRLGVMKTTISKKSGKEVTYPEKSDHFIADFEDVTNKQAMEALFYQVYGKEPKRVTVAFPSDDDAAFFEQWYTAYGSGSGMKCKGDGETANRIVDGEMVELPCPSPEGCEFGQQNGCKKTARLQVFIKGLPVLKIFQINTGSFNSIVNVNSGIDLLRAARRGGSIAGVWFDLTLREQKAQHDGKAVTIYVLDMEIPVSLETLHQLTSAFDVPMALPAPSEARDPYLQPVNGFAADLGVEDAPVPPVPTPPAEPEPESPTPPTQAQPEPEQTVTYRDLMNAVTAFAKKHDLTRAELESIAKDKFGKASSKEFSYQELEKYLAVLWSTYAGPPAEPDAAAEPEAEAEAEAADATAQPVLF